MKVKIYLILLLLILNALTIKNSKSNRKKHKNKHKYRLRKGFTENVVMAIRKASTEDRKKFALGLTSALTIGVSLNEKVIKCFEDENLNKELDIIERNDLNTTTKEESDKNFITQTIEFITMLKDCEPLRPVIFKVIQGQLYQKAIDMIILYTTYGLGNAIKFGYKAIKLYFSFQTLKKLTSPDNPKIDYSEFGSTIGKIIKSITSLVFRRKNIR